jgi:shikimate kinase
MLNSKKLYIIGFMGSGKTTTGKKIASLLGWTFTDLDKKIEEKEGKSIAEIFERFGESYFRTVESDVLNGLNQQSCIVISTGGGTPCHGNNMDFMLETGLTLYLKLTPEQLKSRLINSKGERPLLKNLDEEELLLFINKKLSERDIYYNRAEVIIEGIDTDMNLLCSCLRQDLNFGK